MIHGTSETALQEICQTGFFFLFLFTLFELLDFDFFFFFFFFLKIGLAPTGATDDGFYGQGIIIYF